MTAGGFFRKSYLNKESWRKDEEDDSSCPDGSAAVRLVQVFFAFADRRTGRLYRED